MCRRRFFKSYFYIDYNGVKYQNGETVPVSPFPAAGGSVTITLVAARPWQITNNSWLSISSIQDKSGTYTITLTASANESYSSRSSSFTANTLDERNRIVVSFSQEPQASEKYLYILPSTLNMGAEDTFNSLVCHFVYNGTDTVVTPNWSDDSDVLQVSVNGVLTSNNTDPDPVNGIVITATYVHEGDTLTATSTVNVAAATIQRFITVSPQSLGTAATWTQQLQVTYHQIVNGHEYTEDVTNDADTSYVSDSQIITVNGTGLVAANNTGSTTENATITVTYDDLTPVDVPAVAAPANVEYRNLYVEPSGMTLGKGEEKQIQAFVQEYVNGQYTRDVEVTLAATWASADDSIADVSRSGNNEVVTPVYGQGYYPTQRNTTVTATYLGMTDSCDVTVEPEGIVWYEIEVTPTTKTLSYGEAYNGVIVTYYVVTDGVRDAGTNVTTTSTYSPDNSATTVSVGANVVTLTGNNTGTTDQDTIITVSYPNCESKTITVTNLASVYNPNIYWLEEEIVLPAYWSETSPLTENFEFQDIDPDTIGVVILDGEGFVVGEPYVGSSDGYCDFTPESFNYGTEEISLGHVRVSGTGIDGNDYYADIEVKQEAGVETYLYIEGEATHTDARSDTAGASLIYTIQFSGIEEGSLAISGYEGNISDAYIRVDGESISVTLEANAELTQVTSDLYLIARTVYGDEISAHLIITQPTYVPTCSLVWDVNTFCGDTKYITVAAYRTGNYEQDDLIEAIGYIPQNVSNISLSIVSDTDGMIDNGILAGNNQAQYVIYVNPLNTERHAIVRVEGDGADGNTHHDDLIIFQNYVEPDLLVNGSAIYEVTVTSAFTGNDYTLAWHYADPDSIGIVSYNGFITSCTMGQKTINVDDGECDITVEVAPNTGSSTFENVVTFSGTSVLGLPMTAELHIYQEPQDIPTTTLTWNYSVHFIGCPPDNSFDIRFDLYNGNGENIWDAELSDSSYDDTEVDQTFSGSTTFTVPASTSFAGLYAGNNPQYTGQYWEPVTKVGNVITTDLVVPSLGTGTSIAIHAQAFNDYNVGQNFTYKITLNSLSAQDNTPIGNDPDITGSITTTSGVRVQPVSDSADTSIAGLVYNNYITRMGYCLGITVDNSITGPYTVLRAVLESSTEQLEEIPVYGSDGDYRIYIGGYGRDWNGSAIYLKFIDTTIPPTPTLTITPSAETVDADATAATFTVTWSNIPGGSVNLTASSVGGGNPSFSPNSVQTATTLAGTSGSQQITLYFDKVSAGAPQRTYDVTATAGSLSDSIEITQTAAAMLIYHASPLTLKGDAGHTYYVESVTIKTYDGVRNNEISWAVNHTIDSNGYTAPNNSCTIDYNGMTSSATRISLVMTEITVLLNGNGDRPGAVQLVVKGMTGQSGSRPTNSYFLQADSQNRYKFIIPTNLPSESVGDVLLGKSDDFPNTPEINISIN